VKLTRSCGRVVVASVLTAAFALVGVTMPVAHASAAGRMSSRVLLNALSVRAAHYGGYERTKFTLWTEHPDGCNTRYQVLIRDAIRKPHVGSGCFLSGGKWVSPYDGFTTTNPTKLQIDHVVPLAAAWGAGAWKWNADTRKRFANDLGTRYDLLAVSIHENESKGDDGPDQFLPASKSFDCRYMTDYTAILWRWHLSIDPTEKAFLRRHLAARGWPSILEPKRPAIHDGSSSAPPSGGSHKCTRTSTGNCIKGGEFCPAADNGQTGYDANGQPWVCKHGHWESP
jgi:Protein of unknown function (DUF1524)